MKTYHCFLCNKTLRTNVSASIHTHNKSRPHKIKIYKMREKLNPVHYELKQKIKVIN